MGDKALTAKLTVKFDKFIETDEHVAIVVNGDTLEELNVNAVQFIRDYKERNNIRTDRAEYVIGEVKGLVGSSIADIVGSV